MKTRPSFRAEFRAGKGDMTAASISRWVNTQGEWTVVGVTTATVAAWPPRSTYSALRRKGLALRGRRAFVLAPVGTEGFLGSGGAMARARSVR